LMWPGIVISSLIQLAVLAAIPFFYHLIRRKKWQGFLRYIGWYQPTKKAMWAATAIALLVGGMFLVMLVAVPSLKQEMLSPDTATGKLIQNLNVRGFSVDLFLSLAIIAWIQTALAEEIFFRGFLAKGLIRRFGFSVGNVLQALFFGLLHGGLLLAVSGQSVASWMVLFIVLMPAVCGWLIGWNNEKAGGGSILPGWWAHGLGNTAAYLMFLFMV